MVQVCAHLWAMQQLLFWRAFPCSQDAQLLVHKHMPRAGFLYEYGRPAGAARARVNRDSRNELMELHATQKVCHRRAEGTVPCLRCIAASQTRQDAPALIRYEACIQNDKI